MAALCGIGAATAWTHRASPRVRAAVIVAVLGTAGYGIALLWGAEADPTWLLPTLVAMSLAALVLVAIRVERVGLGGFTGAPPRPTPAELRSGVARGAFRLVLAFPGDDPRLAWVATHCRALDGSPPALEGFHCTPADATG